MQEQQNLDFYEQSLQFHNDNIANPQALATAAPLAYSYTGKGNALIGLGRHDEALEAFKEATRLYPNQSAYDLQVSALKRLGKNEEIIEALNKKIELFPPANVSDYIDIGDAMMALGNIKIALEAYAEATRLAPEFSYVYSHKGDALHACGRSEEALEAYAQSIRLAPELASSHYMQGLIFHSLNREEEAVQSFGQAVTLHPQYLANIQALGFEIVMGAGEAGSDSDAG